MSQRYRMYAEPFLHRLAEAKEAGCPIPDQAVKQTFLRAMREEPVLENWLGEEKWTTAADAHRRIVEKFKDYDAWAMYSGMKRPNAQQR